MLIHIVIYLVTRLIISTLMVKILTFAPLLSALMYSVNTHLRTHLVFSPGSINCTKLN